MPCIKSALLKGAIIVSHWIFRGSSILFLVVGDALAGYDSARKILKLSTFRYLSMVFGSQKVCSCY